MRKYNLAQSIRSRMDSGEKVLALNYARTSTDKDEQKDSCDNQVAMCNIYVKRYPNVRLAEEPYIDRGISGKSNLRRDAFADMLDRIKQGDIDLIIVKTKARLCRSKALATMLEEMMRDYRFSILTLSDGQIYDSSDRSSRLINGIKDVIDEDYVWGQSEYGKMTHELRCERKILTSNNVLYGYFWNKEKKDIEINSTEAEIINKIFEWYVYFGYGLHEISKKLAEIGVYGKNSNKLVTARTLSQWLSSEAYIGVFYINKRGSMLDLGTNRETKRFENPREEWIAISRPDLAIVDRGLFDLAQKVRQERKTVYDKPSKEASQARFRGFHLFASKVFCGSCNSQFVHDYADRAKTIGIYRDFFSKKAKEAGEGCINTRYSKIHEIVLANITKKVINHVLRNTDEIFFNLYNIISEAMNSAADRSDRIKAVNKKLNKLESEKTSYFEGWRTAPDDEMKDYFYNNLLQIKERIEETKKELFALENSAEEERNIRAHLEEIRKQLTALQHVEVLDRNIVDNFVDRIVVNPDGTLYITLKIGCRFKATVPDYDETAASLQRGEAVRYIKNLRDFVLFGGDVGRLYINCTTVPSPPDMPTPPRTC